MKPREILTWKFVVYHAILPLLGRLGPGRADAILRSAARAFVSLFPSYRRKLTEALERIGGSRDLVAELAAGDLRFLARDYLFDGRSTKESLKLFDVEGADAFLEAMNRNKGVILIGSHFGAHISAFHWFYQSFIPIRIMVQRPKHITKALFRYFDTKGDDPQSNFFLQRGLAGSDCVKRVLHARNALKTGKAVYLAGDIPWQGSNTRTGSLLGRTMRFLSVWADLASTTHAPAFTVFCSHGDGGRFSLKLEPLDPIRKGDEGKAIETYFERLNAEIAANPSDAVAHLTWPCFGSAKVTKVKPKEATYRPSRKTAPIPIP